MGFSGGTNTVTPAAGSTGNPSAITVSGGTSTLTMPVAGTAFTPATVNITGGSLNIGTATITTPGWTQSGGTFSSAGTITIPSGGTFNWTGGTLAGTGAFTVSAGATGTLLYDVYLNRPFTNAGTLSQSTSWWGTNLRIGSGGNFTNTGLVELASGSSIPQVNSNV